MTPISRDKITYLFNDYVTMIELMNTFHENTDLVGVICEHCSKLSGKVSKTKFEKLVSIKTTKKSQNIPSNIRVYWWKRWIPQKKISSITRFHFSLSKHDKVVYILVSIKLRVGKYIDGFDYVFDVFDSMTETWQKYDYDTITSYSGYQ